MKIKDFTEVWPNGQFVINEKNAAYLWGFIQETKEQGEELYYKKHGYEVLSIFKNAFVEGYVAGLASIVLFFPKTLPKKEWVECIRSIEDELNTYRSEKLLEFIKSDPSYTTDEKSIFLINERLQSQTKWKMLIDILEKEEEMELYSDLIGCDNDEVLINLNSVNEHVKKIQRDANVHLLRNLIRNDCIKNFNALINSVDLSREEIDLLIKECEVREQIDNDLKEIYTCEAIEGLVSFIKKYYSTNEEMKLWICFLAGISLDKMEKINENPEKEMVFEALHQNLSKKTIIEKLGIPEETVEHYSLNFRDYSNENPFLPELCMPCEFKKNLYNKYIFKPEIKFEKIIKEGLHTPLNECLKENEVEW